jgi:glyoxylase-like metal-dependent hydrolase (beta-lactamase superfamily II)
MGSVKIHTLDLQFFRGETIAAYLVESAGRLALVETGPDSTWPHLVAALAAHGVKPEDVGDVLVTHIHLDHAGAAWRLAKAGANVWVHPRGAPHMADPSKLLASAKRIYKEEMDTLWGTLEPIPADRLKVTQDGMDVPVGGAKIRVLETPGHAIHHNAYLLDGNVFTGDVGGVAIGNGPNLPPTPPPDIDLPTWARSLEKIKAARPDGFYPTHFDRHGDVGNRLDEMWDELQAWAAFVRARLDEGKDEAAIVPLFETWLTERLRSKGVGAGMFEAYRTALPFAMNVTGLVRYWKTTGAAA